MAEIYGRLREMFREPDFLLNLETLVRSLPDFEAKMESRKRLLAIWALGSVEK